MPQVKSSIYLKSFFSEYGLSDAWRFLNPKKREYSFFSNVHHSYSRIDYFISDHAPLILDLTFVNLSSHRRNWHFNTSLLADENFISFIADQISFFLSVNKSPDVSDSVVWEALKAYIRGQIISYATTKRKKSQEKQISLANEISRLDEQYAKSPTPDLYKRRLKLKSELDLLSTNEIEGLLRRTRSVFYESGEKSGKVLANQLRGFQAKHIISGLRLDNGEITTDHSAINEKFRDFYSTLYTADSFLRGDVEDFLGRLNVPTLSSDVRNLLEEPISQEEVIAAITSLQSGKSAGPDGFPSEFNKKFSVQLAPF